MNRRVVVLFRVQKPGPLLQWENFEKNVCQVEAAGDLQRLLRIQRDWLSDGHKGARGWNDVVNAQGIWLLGSKQTGGMETNERGMYSLGLDAYLDRVASALAVTHEHEALRTKGNGRSAGSCPVGTQIPRGVIKVRHPKGS